MSFVGNSPPSSPFKTSNLGSYNIDDEESLNIGACNSLSSAVPSRSIYHGARRLRCYSSVEFNYSDLQKNALVSWVQSVHANAKSASHESLKTVSSLAQQVPQVEGFPKVALLISAVKQVAINHTYNSSLHQVATEALLEVGFAFRAILNSESPCRLAPATPTTVGSSSPHFQMMFVNTPPLLTPKE